ncbi:MAG: NAD-dependent epimerase/dehydratase family protein, partial [Opitutales bacterium]|nr:NAD-dependent epimerase/dehydratase family protein [Opitutales bacterium]
MKILVTGSSGLIGSEVCSYFSQRGHVIHGIDNNQRAVFFGPQGDTSWRLKELRDTLPSFNHHELDIRDRAKVLELITNIKPDAI